MDQRLIVAGLFVVALAISGLLVREIWRTLGPSVEVIVHGAFGQKQRLSRVWGLMPFGLILLGGGGFVVQMFRTGAVFPSPVFSMFWFGACLAMQLTLLVAAKDRRAEVEKRRKEMFGE